MNSFYTHKESLYYFYNKFSVHLALYFHQTTLLPSIDQFKERVFFQIKKSLRDLQLRKLQCSCGVYYQQIYIPSSLCLSPVKCLRIKPLASVLYSLSVYRWINARAQVFVACWDSLHKQNLRWHLVFTVYNDLWCVIAN